VWANSLLGFGKRAIRGNRKDVSSEVTASHREFLYAPNVPTQISHASPQLRNSSSSKRRISSGMEIAGCVSFSWIATETHTRKGQSFVIGISGTGKGRPCTPYRAANREAKFGLVFTNLSWEIVSGFARGLTAFCTAATRPEASRRRKRTAALTVALCRWRCRRKGTART
jgi:hypothetical protein